MSNLNYFRNLADLLSDQNILIDAGSLWRCDDHQCVLVDDDQFITAAFSADVFVKV